MSRSFNHRHHRDEDVLKDGERHRVSMFNMDALDPVQRQIAQSNLSDAEQRAIELTKRKLAADGEHQVTDGEGNGGLALRRPGARLLAGDAAALDAVHEARQQYLDDLTNAWRGDKHRPADQRRSDDDDDDVTGGNQEGAKSRRRKRTQYRDPEGHEAGSSDEFDDRLRRQQSARRQATDEAYADAEREQRDAYKRN
jgi:hypothetical protein